MAPDPWAEFRVGPSPFSAQQADPYRVAPDPILAQRAQAEEERRRQDQARQDALARNTLAQGQASLQSQPLIDESRRLENEARRRELEGGTLSPEDSVAVREEAAQKLRLIRSLDERSRNGWFATGFGAGTVSNIPATTAADVSKDVQTLAAAGALQRIMEMAAANGGKNPLTPLSNADFIALGQSISNLDPTQSDEQFQRNLRAYESIYRRAYVAAGGDPNDLDVAPGDEEEPGLSGTVSDDTPSPYDPGGPLHPNTPKGGGGFLNQLGTATQNVLAGAAQGAAGVYDFPMAASTGVQRGVNWALGSGGGALLDTVGLPGAADWWRRGATGNEARLAGQPTVAGAIEQASPTPAGMAPARFVSQLLGGAMVPLGPKPVPRPQAPAAIPQLPPAVARDIIAEGARNNVRVMTSDVRPPSTFTGRIARATGERIPYAGTGGPRAAQQKERAEAVRELAREFGADASSDLLQEVSDNFSATRGGRIAALSRQKNAVIDGNLNMFTAADAPRTIAAIEQQITRLAGINEEKFAPVIRELSNLRTAVTEGKLLSQIEGNRKLLGDLFEDPGLAAIKGDGQKALNAIYAPLRQDMGDFIRRTTGDGAYTRWAKANEQLAGMAGELNDNLFRNVLRSAETTPENVSRLLFSQKPSEVRRLVGNLSPEGRRKAQGAIIFRAMEKAGGIEDLSPDKFANEIARLGNSVGVVFDGADLARVSGLQRLLQATKQAGVASAAPPTGVQNTPLIGGYAAGSVFGAGAIPFAVGAGALARVYESAPVRNLLVGLAKTTPGTPAEGRMLQRIMKVMASQSQIQPIGRAFNDNLPITAQSAAQDRNTYDRR